jgi:phage terminase small subunit
MTETDPPKKQKGIPNQLTVALPDVEYGPAMRALQSDKHRAFVLNLYTAPSQAEAAARAGFGTSTSSRESYAVIAANPLQNEKIIAAIAEEDKRHMRLIGPRTIRALSNLLESPNHKEHARAVQMGLDRVAPLETKHEITVRNVSHDEEAIEHLRVMQKLGVVRAKLEEIFGYSGLPRYEALLAERDGKGAPKLIETAAVEISPADKR